MKKVCATKLEKLITSVTVVALEPWTHSSGGRQSLVSVDFAMVWFEIGPRLLSGIPHHFAKEPGQRPRRQRPAQKLEAECPAGRSLRHCEETLSHAHASDRSPQMAKRRVTLDTSKAVEGSWQGIWLIH